MSLSSIRQREGEDVSALTWPTIAIRALEIALCHRQEQLFVAGL